jgi:hypothetical protein
MAPSTDPAPIDCTCPLIVLPGEPAVSCPLHDGFERDGVFYKRCGDSDATGGPYFVGNALREHQRMLNEGYAAVGAFYVRPYRASMRLPLSAFPLTPADPDPFLATALRNLAAWEYMGLR